MIEVEIISLPVPVDERDHVIGPPAAPVTVVKYGDYECAGDQKTHRAIERMARELLNKVRLVYRHFPLVHIHPHALCAAEAAEAAAAQGKFWEMNSLLYLNFNKLEDKELRKYAKKVGLDLERFDREMASGVYAEQILKDRDVSISHGITGVPTFFVNDVFYARTGVALIETVRDIAEEHSVIDQ
jgi:protein-disulfide isomerase